MTRVCWGEQRRKKSFVRSFIDDQTKEKSFEISVIVEKFSLPRENLKKSRGIWKRKMARRTVYFVTEKEISNRAFFIFRLFPTVNRALAKALSTNLMTKKKEKCCSTDKNVKWTFQLKYVYEKKVPQCNYKQSKMIPWK